MAYLRVRADLVITRAKMERLDDDHWVALVTYTYPCGARGACEETELIALPEFYEPSLDDGEYAADMLREYYEQKEID